jgi:hypothetical protein
MSTGLRGIKEHTQYHTAKLGPKPCLPGSTACVISALHATKDALSFYPFKKHLLCFFFVLFCFFVLVVQGLESESCPC